MCNQTVSLVAAEIERQGIPTVVLQFLKEVALKVGPPRALWLPFPHGFPLGKPEDPALQKSIMLQALAMVDEEASPLPRLASFGSH
jgi:hypothetical protein